jgi:hypothetical protein
VGTKTKDGTGNLPSVGCHGQLKIPTDEELQALRTMRAVKDRVRELKNRLLELQANDPSINPHEQSNIEAELDRLKKEWNRLEIERKIAARNRMILLGHEEE